MYDSALGRFLSPDPVLDDLQMPQSLNAYSYVGNNPLSFIDPTGLFICDNDDNECGFYFFRNYGYYGYGGDCAICNGASIGFGFGGGLVEDRIFLETRPSSDPVTKGAISGVAIDIAIMTGGAVRGGAPELYLAYSAGPR